MLGMLHCSLLFVSLVIQILIITVKWTCIVIQWIYNTIKYFVDKHKENKESNEYYVSSNLSIDSNTKVYDMAENIESEITEDITIIEVAKEYIKPSIDILN